MSKVFLLYPAVLCFVMLNSGQTQPQVIWTKMFDDSTGYFTSADLTLDEGFILTGPHGEIWVVRTDSNGETVWTQEILDIGDFSNDRSRIMSCSDEGFMLTTGGDPWVIKLDASGDILWQSPFSTLGLDTLPDFDGYTFTDNIELEDGSYVFSGFYESNGNDGTLFVKTNSSGEILWQRSMGGGRIYAVAQATSGELVAGGNLVAIDSSRGAGLMRLSDEGDSLSTIMYNQNWYQSIVSIENTDTGFLLGVSHGGPGRDPSIHIILVDSIGNEVWDHTYPIIGQTFFATQVDTTILTGDPRGDLVLVDMNGDTIWTAILEMTSETAAFDMVKISESEYLYAGRIVTNYEPYQMDGCLIRFSLVDNVTLDAVNPHSTVLLHSFPNPFNPTTTISYDLPESSEVTLTVYDIAGREVKTLQSQEQPAGNYAVQWNGVDESANQVSTGVYFAQLQAGGYSKTIKMVYLK